MAKLSFHYRNFFEPTPKNIARLGNALFAASTSVALPAALTDHTVLATIIFAVGGVGKFLSMFFTEKPEQDEAE